MQTVKISDLTVSGAVSRFMKKNGCPLENVSANIISEKIFTDKKEYIVEMYKKNRGPGRPREVSGEEIDFTVNTLKKLLGLMNFSDFILEPKTENNSLIIKISAKNKDGLIIGKNGQNLLSIQYILSLAVDKELKKHIPVIVDVDAYRDKRTSYLKTLANTMAEKCAETNSEVISEFLPSYERKVIHEEIASFDNLKTISVGKGAYKKVVITPLL